MAKKAKTVKIRKHKYGVPRSIHKHYPDVKFVVDAAEAVDVSVCKADIVSSKSLDPTNCAMARAIKREHRADAAIIGLSSSYIINGDKAIRFATPQSVQREIVSFDRGHDFEPGDYYLTPKSPSNKLGMPTLKGPNSKGGKNKSATQKHVKRVRVLPTGSD